MGWGVRWECRSGERCGDKPFIRIYTQIVAYIEYRAGAYDSNRENEPREAKDTGKKRKDHGTQSHSIRLKSGGKQKDVQRQSPPGAAMPRPLCEDSRAFTRTIHSTADESP